MKRNMMRRNLRRSITKSFGRYIAIAMIIALGAGMFVGLRSTKTDMVETGREYMRTQNMFDLRLLSTYGWDKSQLEPISQLPGIKEAEGVFYSDLIAQRQGGDESAVYRFYTIPEKINRLVLLEGRMPQAPDECLADGFRNGKEVIGKTVSITDDNSDTALDQLTQRKFTVVGLVSTPLYMDTNRGNTTVGSGSITNYFFVPEEAFDVTYYTEIHATIGGHYTPYTQLYNDALSDAADAIKPLLTPFAQERLQSAKQQAEQALADGQEEYRQGKADYEREKADALQQLADSRKQLEDGQQAIEEAEKTLAESEQQIADGKAALEEGQQKIDDSQETLKSAQSGGQSALSSANSTLEAKEIELEAASQAVESGIAQINAGLVQIQSGITQIKLGQAQIGIAIRPVEAMVKIAQTNVELAQQALDSLEAIGASDTALQLAREKLEQCRQEQAQYEAQLSELTAQQAELNAKLDEVTAQQAELEAQREDLLSKREQIRAGRQQIQEGYAEIGNQRTSMNSQIAYGYQQITSGQQQLEDSRKQLREGERELEAGKKELEERKQELADGWTALEEAQQEADEKFQEAEQQLEEAAQKLEDAKQTVADITETEVYVLDRTTNIGYNSLDSNSDIVAGVSRVFPAFFLLVAALVCITTMTRMVDEERTQMGTLKALGYSNFAIVSKYLKYAGSSAIFGCGTGVLVGSVIFPTVLWNAYKMVMFVTPNVKLCFDWKLALSVTALYAAAMMLVSWYCCHRSLQEVPAELIRPKPPTSGKALLIEKLPLWRHISFLNKVAIRNIFRYRQRLVMMLVGIGGCTALLMTGFGIRDSISKIVDVQFRDVTKYDVQVMFRSGRTQQQQEEFCQALESYADEILFYYQVSGEISMGDQTRDIYLMAASENLTDFIDLHMDETTIPMPGQNEVLLSAGMSDILGIKVGDKVVLRNPDMQSLEVTVSGIYENHVYNYAIVTPETIAEQWGEVPQQQMAVISVREGRNPSVAGVTANKQDGVANVTVSQELAEMVDSMMAALDLVVVVVVICAGILAVIVLYNLTNININERIREIATIKVLGFTAGETAQYVFKENLVLSVFGTLFGIPLGKLLLRFVVSQIKIDLIWIRPLLETPSLLLAVALTLLSAVAVDAVFYFRLDKINMAEALKSVE